MSDHEQEVSTPLTGFFQFIKEQALETNLLCPMDVEALIKLAALNQLQQQSEQMQEGSAEFNVLSRQFKQLYIWLHETNKYFIHRDEQTGLWRLGTYLSRKRSDARW